MKIKLLLLFILFLENPIYSQVSVTNNSGGAPGDFLGWTTGPNIPLDIRNNAPYTGSNDPSINFWIGGVRLLWIDAATTNVAVGNSIPVNPPFKLTVENDIDLECSGTTPVANGYRINGDIILAVPGTQNTFVGVNAGTNTTTGFQNTFIGNNSGSRTTTAEANSFYGYLSGNNVTTGSWNTLIGSYNGQSLTTEVNNTFVGHHCGFSTTGNNNTFMGAHAALNGSGGVEDNVVIGYQAMMNYTGGDRNTVVGTYAGRDHENGSDNAFYGYRSGQLTSSGNNNTFLGNHAGRWNQTGSSNTYVGYFAGQPATGGHNFINSAAIGANAIVRNSNQMILGNNSVLVGIGLSDNATGSRDKLEINASVSGVSGLQFTTLNYGFVPSSIATKFLTVDGNGKVILRDIPSGSGNVIACATPGPIGMIPRWTGITGPNFELCNSIIYDNLANVGISNTTPNQKLDVNGNVNLTRFDQSYYIGNKRFLGSGGSGFSSSIELGFDAGPASGANSGYDNIFIGYRTGASLISGEQFNILIGGFAGVSLRGVGSFPEASQNVLMGYKSGEAVIEGSENTFIGHRSGSSTGLSKSGWNSFFGSFAGARNEDEGDYNTLLGYNTNLDISRSDVINYSTALGADAWVGSSRTVVIGSSESTTTLIGYNILPSPSIPNTCRLYVNSLGDAAFFNGDCYSSGTFIPSDSSLKLNIVAVQRNLSSNVLDGLNPKTYTFDSRNNPSLNLPSGQQIGLMADEVERVMPNLVHEFTSPAQYDSSGMIIANEKTFKAVNYTGLIPVLIDEAKNSKEKIDSITDVISNLQDRVDRLERTVAACCSNASGLRKVIPNQDVELANSIILNQNSPNPFAEQTVIEYSISDSFNAAKIIFYNQSGVILKTVKIESSGKGQITVYAENLSAGIYSYSLLVDGKVIDTKRMVCAK